MNSITQLPKHERDALLYWASSLTTNDPVIVCVPHDYLPIMEAFGMNITDETRRESYRSVLKTVTARQDIILKILQECGDMTAQEIACELHRRGLTPNGERNFSAPRLTELKKAGKVRTAGKKICCRTGRTVTVWSASAIMRGKE